MTNQTADAAAAPHAAVAAAVQSKEKHGLTCTDAAGCGAAVSPEDGARGGDGAVVLIGTSNGTLHCIGCSYGQMLWQMQTGGNISTAAGFSPASRAHAPSEAPAAAGTDALAGLLSNNLAATHEGVQTDAQTDPQADTQTDPQTDAQARCSVQHQQLSPPAQQPGILTQMQMTSNNLLISCHNNGGIRVLSLPAVACSVKWQNPELLQSGQQAASPDKEVRQLATPRTWAAAQMPGECMVC